MPKISNLPNIGSLAGAKIVASDSTGDAVNIPITSLALSDGVVEALVQGTGVTINSTDPQNPIVAIDPGAVVLPTLDTTANLDFVLDEDDLASDSPIKLPTQQSVKAYADALPWQQSGGDAVTRTVQTKLRETVSVLDFRDAGDANWTATFTKAIDYLQSVGGGRLKIPAGTYDMGDQLDINPIVGIGWNNIVLDGDGRDCTILDFDNAGPTDDGIAIFGWGGRFGIKDLSVINAPAIGININKGETVGGSSHISRWYLSEVIVDGCGSDGVAIVNGYMATLTGVESRNNGGRGFALLGFITSLQVDRCWAGGDAASPSGGNAGIGWDINGAVYTTFRNCSADWNGGPGWRVRNVAAVGLLQCASENNGQEGILLQTSTASVSGISSVAQNVKGLIVEGFFALNNSRLGANSYANFLGASTADSRPIELEIRGCRDENTVGTTISVVLNGSSGTVKLHDKINFLGGSFALSGAALRQNETVAGRRVLARLSADQSVADSSVSGTEYSAQLATLTFDELGCSLSSNDIVLPAGVSRVKCVAGAFWNNNSTGIRQIRVVKNGGAGSGFPQDKRNGNGFTPHSIITGTIDVNPSGGDTIGLRIIQTSGGSLDLINNGATFIEVVAVG